jgi:hypothetical protein
MECPYCKKNMKKGSIHCHNGLFPMVWKSQEGDLSRKILPWYKGFTRNKIEDIYYCSNCDVIIKKMTSDNTE